NWADALREQKQYEQAAEKCQEAIELDREFPDAYFSLGLVRAAQERFDEAIEQYRQADELWEKKGSKNRKHALWLWAVALHMQEHYEQAAEKYQEAIGIDRDFPDAYNSLGRMRVEQERFDEAIEQYRQADKLWQAKASKDRKYALRDWADALCLQGHYDEAADKCQEAIGIDREYPDAYRGLGQVRVEQERFDEAIEQYRQADKLWQKEGPKNRKDALRSWAYALREQKHYEEAAEKCLEAIELDRLDPLSLMLFGGIRAAQERFDEAIEQYRQADKLWQKKESKDRKNALWNWGWALRRQEKFEDAKTKFDCARQIVKGDAQAVHYYGHSLIDLGQYQDAIAQFDKASTLDQDDPEPHHSKANLLFMLGHYEQ